MWADIKTVIHTKFFSFGNWLDARMRVEPCYVEEEKRKSSIGINLQWKLVCESKKNGEKKAVFFSLFLALFGPQKG